MSEWLKEHAWKACVGETLPRVRIPLSPPTFAKRSLRSRLRLAGRVWRTGAKVVHRSAQRGGGRPPVAEIVPNSQPSFARFRRASAKQASLTLRKAARHGGAAATAGQTLTRELRSGKPACACLNDSRAQASAVVPFSGSASELRSTSGTSISEPEPRNRNHRNRTPTLIVSAIGNLLSSYGYFRSMSRADWSARRTSPFALPLIPDLRSRLRG